MIHTDGKPTIVSDRIEAPSRHASVFGLKRARFIASSDGTVVDVTVSAFTKRAEPTNDGSMEYGAWRVVRELRMGLAEREHIRTKNDVLLVLAELEDEYEGLCRGR